MDTGMNQAYLSAAFFNTTFTTNDYLERALLTGITRISKESIFSDINNLEVVTATSDKYVSSFGFTEEEVIQALDKFGLSENFEKVKYWYDGFRYSSQKDIYNPWSTTKYLDSSKFDTYWANTSSNTLVGELIQQGLGKEVLIG